MLQTDKDRLIQATGSGKGVEVFYKKEVYLFSLKWQPKSSMDRVMGLSCSQRVWDWFDNGSGDWVKLNSKGDYVAVINC